MEKEIRKPRSYKIKDSVYQRAMKRAVKEKVSLATIIEVWLICYGSKTPFYIDSNNTPQKA